MLLDELLRRLDPLDELLLRRLELSLGRELRSLSPERDRCACILLAPNAIAASNKQIDNANADRVFGAGCAFMSGSLLRALLLGLLPLISPREVHHNSDSFSWSHQVRQKN